MVFFLRLCAFFVGIISIIFFSISEWFYKTFGTVNINQAIWHIENLDLSVFMTVDSDFKIRCLKFSLFLFVWRRDFTMFSFYLKVLCSLTGYLLIILLIFHNLFF